MSPHVLLDRPEATTRSIDDLLRDVKLGKIRIPQFQRSFTWEAKDVVKLFDSIYRGYPIGDLLFWETDLVENSTTSFGSVSFDPAKGNALLVIDGQQRLVSLVRVLLRRSDERQRDSDTFRVYFDLDEARFINLRRNDRPPEHALPLSEVADTLRYLEWLRNLPQGPDHERQVDAANQVARALRDYRVPVYIVHSAGEKDVREIFERLNSGGKPLKAPEIFNAIHGRRDRGGPGDLDALQRSLVPLGFGEMEESWLLKAVGAILGLDVSKSKDLAQDLKTKDEEEVLAALSDTRNAVERVIGFLRQVAGIPHIALLPYRFPLVPLAKLFHLVPSPSEGSCLELSWWLWRSACTMRHQRTDAPTIRAALLQISDDEEGTVRLLAQAVEDIREVNVDLKRHDFRSANTKLICNGLASLRPMNLETGEPVDVVALVDKEGPEAFLTIIPHKDAGRDGGGRELLSSTANRLLQPRGTGGLSIDRLLLRSARPALASHAISDVALDNLGRGDEMEFLERRQEELALHVKEYLRDRCGL